MDTKRKLYLCNRDDDFWGGDLLVWALNKEEVRKIYAWYEHGKLPHSIEEINLPKSQSLVVYDNVSR